MSFIFFKKLGAAFHSIENYDDISYALDPPRPCLLFKLRAKISRAVKKSRERERRIINLLSSYFRIKSKKFFLMLISKILQFYRYKSIQYETCARNRISFLNLMYSLQFCDIYHHFLLFNDS